MEYQKNSRKEDSRALLESELSAFLGDNPRIPLNPFVQLVKDYSELELCFRGNSESSPRVSIYSNNHVIFSVFTTGKIVISFNHARYCKNWEKYFKTLTKEYGFNGSINKTNKKGDIDIGEMTRSLKNNKPLTYPQVRSLYETVLRPMFDVYFKAEGKSGIVDYFKHGALVKVAGKTEKKRQQEIYSRFTSKSNGYFFYDLEFAQRHESIEALRDDKSNNKPDMQAIRFDSNGKPEKIVFVEVKCTDDAMKGSSGLAEHLKKMTTYEKLEDRRKEACQIMNQYAKLGLRGLSDNDIYDYEDFARLELEILLVFTDKAIGLWENSSDFADDRKIAKKINYEEDPNICLYRI